MTTGTPQRNVLLIGKSQRVLDDTAAALRDLGHAAQATNEFLGDITGRFDLTDTDLVVLSGAVPHDRKAELKQQIAAINPKVTFLEGLAGIPGLITSQIQEALTTSHQGPTRAPAYTPGDRTIRLTLAAPAAVKVTAWWWTSTVPPDPTSGSLLLISARLGRRGHGRRCDGERAPHT